VAMEASICCACGSERSKWTPDPGGNTPPGLGERLAVLTEPRLARGVPARLRMSLGDRGEQAAARNAELLSGVGGERLRMQARTSCEGCDCRAPLRPSPYVASTRAILECCNFPLAAPPAAKPASASAPGFGASRPDDLRQTSGDVLPFGLAGASLP
jgi:hypothetical protein